MNQDFLSLYSAKGAEYIIAVLFVVLFIPFWRFVNKETDAE